MPEPPVSFLEFGGNRLACRLRPASGRDAPTLFFLPGYASDMDGAKAVAIAGFAARRGLAMARFDYSGTGLSDGRFEDGTLDRWLSEALKVLDELTKGPVILVGSSMGGWIALHIALHRPGRVAAVVGIAAAPDFTDWGFTAEQKGELLKTDRIERPNPYGGESQLTTRGFWESGERLRVLDGSIELECPVRLLHGDADDDVPLEVAFRLMPQLRSADIQLTIVKGGGHRLSEPNEIAAILRTLDALMEPLP